MKYTLITSKGRVYTFYVMSVAELYQSIYGGQLITAQILVDTVTV